MNNTRQRIKRRIRTIAGAEQTDAVIAELRQTVADQRVRIGDLERELDRVSPQVAALESRLETLRETVERGASVPSDVQDAQSLRAEIQQQQEQVRARISAAARFEERLRKLEEDRAHR